MAIQRCIFVLVCTAGLGHQLRLSRADEFDHDGADPVPDLQAQDASSSKIDLKSPFGTLAAVMLAFRQTVAFQLPAAVAGNRRNDARIALPMPSQGVPRASSFMGDFIKSQKSAPQIVSEVLRGKGIGAPYAADAKGYDPVKAEKFYAARLPIVASRLATLISKTQGFSTRLLLDFLTWKFILGEPEEESWPNEDDRAKEVLDIATKLGPTFIKLAQAASIREDIIPRSYAQELQQLQDAVPPFDDTEAKAIIAEELGVNDLSEIFSSLSDRPLASASIGQVYKGVLKDGREVAIKVQRPGILDEIALDMHLLRMLTPLQTYIVNFINGRKTYPDDIELGTKLVDEWSRGFVAETDYKYEASNTIEFTKAMERRGLLAVTSPGVVKEFSTTKILVTEWVDGTRLDRDVSPDVPRLCGVAINAYMTMLLDTGVLHCDPHPGNLLRTKDGKLCILDWGMTQAVPDDLQYSLIEFIAHVTSEDFEAIPDDFVNLGFTPPDQLERLKASNLADGLSFVLRQLSGGGGAKKAQERVREEFMQRYDPEGKLSRQELRQKIMAEFADQSREVLQAEGEADVSVMDVQAVMEKMQQRNRELFKVPPYVLYCTRAFATLEGIGLSADGDYAIITEAFPYISQRLINDQNPRAKAALRSLLYGSADKDAAIANPNYDRLLSIGEGATTFSSSTSMLPGEGEEKASKKSSGSDDVPGSKFDIDAADDLIDQLLSADGNYVQDLLLQEAAKLADAAVREQVMSVSESEPANQISEILRTPKRIADSTIGSLPLPDFIKGPLTAPANLMDELTRIAPALSKPSETDAEALKAFGSVWDKLSPQITNSLSERAGDPSSSTTESSDSSGPSPQQENAAGALLEQLNDPDSQLRKQVLDPNSGLRRRLPLLGTLSRRFATTLLNRVAARLEADAKSQDTPGLARELASRTAEVDRNLASMIEPVAPTAEEKEKTKDKEREKEKA